MVRTQPVAVSIFDALQRQRLVNALLVAFALSLFLIGTYWDIQWHASVGRDRVLTPPHLMMLAGISLIGLASLTWIVLETWQAQRNPSSLQGRSSRMFGLFRSSVGFALSGFGALFSTIAFPLDDYWHSLYGIDVTLWAPFHVMIISGMILGGLGLAYSLISERNRAGGVARTTFGVLFAFSIGLTLGTLFLLLPPSVDSDGILHLFGQSFLTYPILIALTVPLGVYSLALVSGAPGAATIMALGVLAMRQIGEGFVPWATAALVTAQGLEYRPGGPSFVVATFVVPIAILVAAVLIDATIWATRGRNTGARSVIFAGSVVASLAAALLSRPWAVSSRLPTLFPELDLNAALVSSLPLTVIAAILGSLIAVVLARGFKEARG